MNDIVRDIKFLMAQITKKSDIQQPSIKPAPGVRLPATGRGNPKPVAATSN